MSKYYDGTRLFASNDINGKRPEIFMVSGNRTGGKTTFWSKFLVDKFLKEKKKFMLIYRYQYELEDCHTKFFKDIGELFYPGMEMLSIKKGHGAYYTMTLNGLPCGYAVSLNGSEIVKKNSHTFNDVEYMFFDEFQSETNTYLPKEVTKLISIHTSVARGKNKQVRYVPLIMCSNSVSLINPYFTEMGISHRLRSDTKFLRGDGFVLEQNYNESASKQQKESAFNRAFSNNKYVGYASENRYLNDSQSFIDKVKGKSKYICTIRFEGSDYAIRTFEEQGIVYCDNSVDTTFPLRISVTTEDHNINYVMVKQNEWLITTLRFYFERGAFRFKNLSCKQAVMKMISY